MENDPYTDDLESQETNLEVRDEVSLMMISFLLPQVQAEHT